jgi:hypothetical protein
LKFRWKFKEIDSHSELEEEIGNSNHKQQIEKLFR